MPTHEHVFSDAARFKYLSRLLVQKGHRTFPSWSQIEEVTRTDFALRAWTYRQPPHRFLREAKFFFARELKRRRTSPSNDT